MASGKGYDDFYKGLPKDFAIHTVPDMNEENLTNFVTQMATVQVILNNISVP